MTDWRSEQIGLGVSRCPGDNDNFDALIERDLLDELHRMTLREVWSGNPLPVRESPMQGELGTKPIRWPWRRK